MPEGTGRELDPDGEARSVLRQTVADYGTTVLSNPAIIDGICEDRLPDWPREASLISVAARTDVAAMLQQADAVDAGTAVRLTAATLAETRSLDPAACVWVVSEFARALGYEAEALGYEAETAAKQPQAGVPGEPVTAPPPAADSHPRTEIADIGQAETVSVSAGQGEAPSSGVTEAAARPAEPGAGPPGNRTRNRVLVAIAGVAGIVLLYLGIAGLAHIPPFTRSTGPEPSPTSSQSASTSPSRSRSPTPRPATAAERKLTSLIPASVSAGGSCSPVRSPRFGAVAEVRCEGAPNIPAGSVQYYLYSNVGSLTSAYSTFLAEFAHTRKNTGKCYQLSGRAAFQHFYPPCETEFALGGRRAGRVAEYYYKGHADITCLLRRHLVLADLVGSNGSAMMTWWVHVPNWLA
ncbi:MAG TPA: hypothetical protein VF834_07460, partial [Streptosporangiaceae bacterium]